MPHGLLGWMQRIKTEQKNDIGPETIEQDKTIGQC
jgi:hypothetical protein